MSTLRVIVWGPGWVGGPALRRAYADPAFDVVGVKVFDPAKHGKDAGELVGIGPIGVRATTSRQEILDLDADCVIFTPHASAVYEGIDEDVIDLLESGKNVVTTAAYHNPTMPNWHNTAVTPMQRMREFSRMTGAAQSPAAQRALQAMRSLTDGDRFDRVGNRALQAFTDRRFPLRATPERILAACRRGNVSLHGTGLHPGYMVQRQLMRMCQPLSRVDHIRVVDAGDFSRLPEGRWGGLNYLGFGRDPREIDDDWFVAKSGDYFYGDLIGNVAHILYGATASDVRIERTVRTQPARSDFRVGSTHIARGSTAVLRLMWRGYLGDHHFFTNEEYMFLTPENEFHDASSPFGNLPNHGGYTFAVTGEPTSIHAQIAIPELRPGDNPYVAARVSAVLDAIAPVCAAAPGVLVEDSGPQFTTSRSGHR